MSAWRRTCAQSSLTVDFGGVGLSLDGFYTSLECIRTWLQWIIQVSSADVQDPPHGDTCLYLSRLITARVCRRTLRSSTVPLMSVQFPKTDSSGRAIRYSTPTKWNSPSNIVTAK